jgi:hypothetical protein
MERKKFVAAGFWGSIGFALGIGSIIIAAIAVYIIPLYYREYKEKASYEWKRLWYTQDQRKFEECYRKEYTYMNTLPNDWSIDKRPETTPFGKYLKEGGPTEKCKEKGLKPFGIYKNQSAGSNKQSNI